MVKETANKLLDLMKNNSGLAREALMSNNIDIKKITEMILAECRCSIVDDNGNYSRYGSSTDIRIIRNLVQIFLSNSNKIPAEVVSNVLTKEEIIGPFTELRFEKRFIKEKRSIQDKNG